MPDKTTNMLTTHTPLIVALMKETNEAYSCRELTLHLGISYSACTNLLYYMTETDVLDLRRIKVPFYFLNDTYTEKEIKYKVEKAYMRNYNIKSIRRVG